MSALQAVIDQYWQLEPEERDAFWAAVHDQPTPEEDAELNRRYNAAKSGQDAWKDGFKALEEMRLRLAERGSAAA